ncbi:hypothetical protein [Streptomyces sp. NPDC002580]|uniref:hypothetical protein n=1 Tax=Streptomyces sp. NPDC002580 TaxID=3364653 RepID=UPI0036B461EA
MVKGHGKKQRAQNRSRRTGAAHASAAANATHTHTPLPDMAILNGFPFLAGEDVDTDLAARLVAACRIGCQPCQKTMTAKVVKGHRPTLAALAAAVYGVLPLPPGPAASPTTRSWEPLAKAAKTDRDAGVEALAAVMRMDDEAAAELLDDALDHWAVGGATPEQIADIVTAVAPDGPAHFHTRPDTGFMEGTLPYVPGWEIDHELATTVVSAVWAGCGSCRRKLTPQVVASRATLAGLAGAVFLTPRGEPVRERPAAGPAVRAWIEQAHGKFLADGAQALLQAVDELSEDDAADLLREALDAWAASEGARDAAIGLGDLMEAPPRQRPDDPMDAFREAGVQVVTLDDLDLPEDVDPYYLAPNYGVVLMRTATPDGRPLPMLVLYPETEDAGIEDLERRTDWEHWGLHGMPEVDPRWRVRARISDRSLQGLVHVGPDGEDDHELWRAAESVSLPTAAWDLLDTAQHMLVAGPVKNADAPGALQAAGDAGELLAVVARVSFH